MSGYIAVHVGAGEHSVSNHPVYKLWMKEACRKGQLILKEGGSAVEAVAAAIQELESCELTNAGYGSVLTNKGTVECDAGIMDGGSLRHAGVGAVSGIKHPIAVAHKLLTLQSKPLLGNLVPPALLVGEGAVEWAASNGLQVCDESKLVSAKSLERHRYYLRHLRRLKHKQKKEKLAGVTSKDGLRNSTYDGNSRKAATANVPSGEITPSSTNTNPVNYTGYCETVCNGESKTENNSMGATAGLLEPRKDGEKFSSESPAGKHPAGVQDHSHKSMSCDSNMETGDEPDFVEGLSVHQGDSSSPVLKKSVDCRNDLTCKIKSDPNSDKLLITCKQNLRCEANDGGKCCLEEHKHEARSCDDRVALLTKLSLSESKEEVTKESLHPAYSLTAGLQRTKESDRNTNGSVKHSSDECDSLSSNHRHKRMKIHHSPTSPALRARTSNSSTDRKSLQSVLDTVGCVAVGADGTVAAGASSGGILLKTPGRVGQSAILGAGYWAENCCKEGRHNVAVCTSGCGEMLVSSHLAMNAASTVALLAEPHWSNLPGAISALMLDSKFLQMYSRPKSSGCLILKHDPKEGSTDLYSCHTSISFGYAYMSVQDKKPTAVFSTMKPEQEGQDVVINCMSYYPPATAEPKPCDSADGLRQNAMIPTWKILDPDCMSAESSKTTPSTEEMSGLDGS